MKMYKKPITDTILVNTDEMMDSLYSSGGTTESNNMSPGSEGDAPQRRTPVF